MESLKNKIVFVTGASSGIGRACAEQFAALGANLILCARRENLLEKFAAHLKKKYKVMVLSAVLDVRNKNQVISFIDSLKIQWKKIDVLVNNAGLARGLAPLHEDDIDNWEEMIDTNVKGLLYVTRAVAPLMEKRKKGHIINIGSIAGREVYPKGGVYCGTKHAVYAITKALRMDLVEKNIRVSTVDPGMVETEFSIVRFHGDEQKAGGVYKGLKPLSAQDIAEAVIYMATRPAHVNIAEMVLLPTRQASATVVHRD